MRCKTISAPPTRPSIARKTFRFLWALSVLLLKLVVIFSSRTLCFFIDLGASTKPSYTQINRGVPDFENAKKVHNYSKIFIVYLSKTDSNFAAKKARLKLEGYRWHSGLNAWALPTMRYENNEPEFHKKISELNRLGYVWNRETGLWTLTFPKYHAVRVNQQKQIKGT